LLRLLHGAYVSFNIAQAEHFEHIGKVYPALRHPYVFGVVLPRYLPFPGQATNKLDQVAPMWRFRRPTLGHLYINLIGCPIVHNKAVQATLS
jgi:hypothetical protein